MAEKLTATFTTAAAAIEAVKGQDIGKKKLYAVTLPSIEAYKAFLDAQKAQTFYMHTDGYASTAYTILRYLGGEVSVGEKSGGSAVAIAAANAAKEAAEEAARKAAAEAESTKQLLAALQKQMEELRAAQAANNGPNPEPTTAGGRGRKPQG